VRGMDAHDRATGMSPLLGCAVESPKRRDIPVPLVSS
jgi:hypothetical protein